MSNLPIVIKSDDVPTYLSKVSKTYPGFVVLKFSFWFIQSWERFAFLKENLFVRLRAIWKPYDRLKRIFLGTFQSYPARVSLSINHMKNQDSLVSVSNWKHFIWNNFTTQDTRQKKNKIMLNQGEIKITNNKMLLSMEILKSQMLSRLQLSKLSLLADRRWNAIDMTVPIIGS